MLFLHFWNSPIQIFFPIYHTFFGITSVFHSGMNKKDGVNAVSLHVETAYQKDVLLLITYNSTGNIFRRVRCILFVVVKK